jgi:hypothetical protein
MIGSMLYRCCTVQQVAAVQSMKMICMASLPQQLVFGAPRAPQPVLQPSIVVAGIMRTIAAAAADTVTAAAAAAAAAGFEQAVTVRAGS